MGSSRHLRSPLPNDWAGLLSRYTFRKKEGKHIGNGSQVMNSLVQILRYLEVTI